MIDAWVRFISKYSRFLLIIVFFFVLLASFVAVNLKIDPDFGTLVSPESVFNTNDRILNNAFETNDAFLILLKLDESTTLKSAVTSMNDSRVQDYVQVLTTTLKESQYVTGVSQVQYSEDMRYARVLVSLSTPKKLGSTNEVKSELDYLVQEAGGVPGVTVLVTGMPVLINQVSTLLITDNLNTILITFVFIFIILFWYSRNLTFTLITIAIPIISLIFLAALMVWLSISVTITLAAVGVLMLGLGADYAIHTAVHYKHARHEHESHKKAMFHTLSDLKTPITASFITTLAGFGALIFGVSPSSQAQGKVLALGISVIYLCSFLIFPLLLSAFHKKLDFRPNKTFDKIISFMTKLAIYQAHKAKTVLTILFLLTLVMMYGASKVAFSTSNSNWIPESDPIASSFREISAVYGNVDSITLLITATKGDLRNVQTQRDVEILKSAIEGIPNVDLVSSPYDGIPYDTAVLYDAITNNQTLRSQFNYDYTLTTITISSENLDQDEAGKSKVFQEVKKLVEMYPVHNADISYYGDVVRFDELGDSLQRDAGVTTVLGLGLVFVAAAIYASLMVGVLSLIPIIIAVIWAIGLMGFFNIPFTSLSTGIISLVLGVGVDFSIHLVDSIKKYLSRGKQIEEAIIKTLEGSGSAILLSSLTTFVGFMALTFAVLLGTRRLGLALAVSIVAVFIVSISLVPALMSLTTRKKAKTISP